MATPGLASSSWLPGFSRLKSPSMRAIACSGHFAVIRSPNEGPLLQILSADSNLEPGSGSSGGCWLNADQQLGTFTNGGTMERIARCQCGALTAIVSGEPLEVGVCHCTGCQRRTGSAFGVGAYFPKSQVRLEGGHKEFRREADNGRFVTNSFCPSCGSTIYWELDILPNGCGVAVGAFADPRFPAPTVSWWNRSAHTWAQLRDNVRALETQ